MLALSMALHCELLRIHNDGSPLPIVVFVGFQALNDWSSRREGQDETQTFQTSKLVCEDDIIGNAQRESAQLDSANEPQQADDQGRRM